MTLTARLAALEARAGPHQPDSDTSARDLLAARLDAMADRLQRAGMIGPSPSPEEMRATRARLDRLRAELEARA